LINSVKISNISYLIFALAFSAGVMTYISMVEMMSEASDNFKNTKMNEVVGQTLFFFVGILICNGLEYIINKLDGSHSSLEIEDCLKDIRSKCKKGYRNRISNVNISNFKKETEFDSIELNENEINGGKSKTTLINVIENESDSDGYISNGDISNGDISNGDISNGDISSNSDFSFHSSTRKESKVLNNENRINLKNIGILTALVITLHNIPEGIATFTSSLSNVNIGLMLTIAIAIHNIPEGLCVAFPIYYYSGSKIKAFLWGGVSGLSELASALIEYIILKLFHVKINDFTPMVYGIIYSIISGIMVYISFCELLPTAIKLDNKGNITKYGFLGGMFVMAISLVLLDNI